MGSVQAPTSTPRHAPTTGISPTALVKGAGPTGLASAAALARLGFNVTVVEKRPRRTPGAGRQNVVAIRPEALRNLDSLGALEYLVTRGALTDMTSGKTVNEWDGSVFDWIPLFQRYPATRSLSKEGHTTTDDKEYVVPDKITDQIPSSYVLLGDVEDALLDVCEQHGVNVVHECTLGLEELQAGSDSKSGDNDNNHDSTPKYAARLKPLNQVRHEPGGGATETTTMVPDLIVCASGKNDTDLASDLGFRRRIGVKLDEQCLFQSPASGADIDSSDTGSTSSHSGSNVRALNLGEDGEMESQHYAVFAVRHSARNTTASDQAMPPESTNGFITHVIRKNDTGTPPQPLTEITMSHKDVSHCIVHLPRQLHLDAPNASALDSYVTDRVNARFHTNFSSVQDMRDQDALVVGDPLTPVLVETATAPKYVFGSNVILVGDAAMSCSPASGVGADIGMTVDSRNVGTLGADLIQAMETKADEHPSSEPPRSTREQWQAALNRFHRRRAEAAIAWSQASRMFYITSQEASDILRQTGGSRGDGIAVT